MNPLQLLGRVTTSDGTELALYRRDNEYQIRIDGLELMSSRSHRSEGILAELACGALEARRSPRVLVGGLGLGYSLRAALGCLPASAAVVVAEVFPAVVEWNRGPLADLAGRPLEDPRVTVVEKDVGRVIEESAEPFDAIILDVDNGPSGLTLASNRRLYTAPGLSRIQRALTAGGALVVWTPSPEPAFCRRLRRAGFAVRARKVAARHGAHRPRHTIVLARRTPLPAEHLEFERRARRGS